MTKYIKPLFIMAATIAAIGCSSDNETSSYDDSYIQFYNISPNSKSTSVTLIEGDTTTGLGSATFGDVISAYAATPGQYSYSISYLDESDQTIEVSEKSISLNKGNKTLILFSGDYNQPVFSEISFARQDIDDIELHITNFSSKTYPLEVLIATTGKTIEQAQTIGNVQYRTNIVSDLLTPADYTIYLKNADTGEVMFESEALPLNYSLEYVLVIKDAYGPSQSKLSIDIITNSTTVNNYDDTNSMAQFRIINAESDLGIISLKSNGKTPMEIENIAVNQVTPYSSVEFGDYQLSLYSADENKIVDNKLLSLEPNDSKTIIFYRDLNQDISALNFKQTVTPSSYQHQFHLLNLIDDFDSLQLYFLKTGETTSTASNIVKGVSFAKLKQVNIDANSVNALLIHEDSNGQQTLLDRVDNISLTDLADIIVIADESTSSEKDYQLTIIK